MPATLCSARWSGSRTSAAASRCSPPVRSFSSALLLVFSARLDGEGAPERLDGPGDVARLLQAHDPELRVERRPLALGSEGGLGVQRRRESGHCRSDSSRGSQRACTSRAAPNLSTSLCHAADAFAASLVFAVSTSAARKARARASSGLAASLERSSSTLASSAASPEAS